MSGVRKRVLGVGGHGVLIALVVLGIYMASCGRGDRDLASTPPGWKLGEVTEEGEMTYRMMCETCHGESGDGKGPAAAALAAVPRDFTDREYMKTRSDWQIYTAIKDGGTAVGLSSAMPSWKGALAEEQILQVAAFIRQFSEN